MLGRIDLIRYWASDPAKMVPPFGQLDVITAGIGS